MSKNTKNDDLKSIELAKSIWRDRKRRLDAYMLTTQKVDPMFKAMAKELEYLEAAGFLKSTDAELVEAEWEKEKSELLKEYSSLSHEDLIQRLLQAKFDLNKLEDECGRQYDMNEYLRKYFDDTRSKYLTESKKIKNSLRKLNDPNERALVECINLLMVRLGREPIGSDYPAFKRLLLQNYPSQPHIKKPRITKAERELGENVVTEELALKHRVTWAESSLRSFFAKTTGFKPTTKK